MNEQHFETGKAIIEPSSYTELDELVKYMELKPNIKIEVGGHTDDEGSESGNLILSENRANAVRDYLMSKGIDGNRIKAKGYGESNPIGDNDTEAGRALNRRTEIRIIQ